MARRSTEELEACRGAIRRVGLRATASRIAVLWSLRRKQAAMSHSERVHELSGESWDRATIYRNLVDLTNAELVKRIEVGDRTWRFEAVDPEHQAGAHPHFLCVDCGTVECLPQVSVEAGTSRVPRSVKAREFEVQLRGVCNDCD